MALILENISGAQLQLDDLGFALAAGASIDLSVEGDSIIVSKSAEVGGDLHALITSSAVVIKDPIDNVTNLSTTDAINVCRVHNDPHYRMPIGARVVDISDVVPTSLAANDILQWNGTSWVNISFPPTGADLASVTVGLSASTAIPTTWTNVSWPVTHIENDTSVIEHSNTNTDRILIKESGLYFIAFAMSFDADAGEENIQGRVLINNTTVVPGSFRLASEDDEINDLSNMFTAELTAGTYLTFQHLASGTGNLLHSSSNFCVTRAKGATGEKGDPGAGSSITVKDEGANVTGGPHDTLNFVGSNVAVTNAGSGEATVTVSEPIFGTQYTYSESNGVSTTTSTSFVHKLTMTTSSLPAGTYRIGWSYQWNHDNASNDFEGRVYLDGNTTTPLSFHLQEPKDSGGSFSTTGTNQQYMASGFKHQTLTSGVHTVTVDFRTNSGADESSIWNTRLELWRVS